MIGLDRARSGPTRPVLVLLGEIRTRVVRGQGFSSSKKRGGESRPDVCPGQTYFVPSPAAFRGFRPGTRPNSSRVSSLVGGNSSRSRPYFVRVSSPVPPL